jgi:hypothetical protein
MGKKLIINGADFSANAVETDYSWITVLEGAVTSENNNDMKTITLSENLPEGTVTRLTQQATGSSSNFVGIGAIDSDDIQHNTFWHDPIETNSGEVIDIKTLPFDMKSLLIWLEKPGITATYKLEVRSV